MYHFFLVFGCETVLQLSFAGLLYKKKLVCLYETWRLPELVLLGKRLETASCGPAEVRAGLGFREPKRWLCVCVGDVNIFVTNWPVTLHKLGVTVRSGCVEPGQPLPQTARERRLSPVKKPNAGLPLGKNSLTCHFSEIICETKLIPSCWLFLAAPLPSEAILYFLFSHSLFFLSLSPGSSIISSNLYFLSLPSYCFVSFS